MKKHHILAAAAACLFGAVCSCSNNQPTEKAECCKAVPATFAIDTTTAYNVSLPEPQTTGGMPLMEALSLRKTDRSYSGEALSDAQISNLLWAAGGVNRRDADGDIKLTSPTARNAQQMDIYAFTHGGAYLYDAKNNALKLVKKGNFIAKTGNNDFHQQSSIGLIFVANYDKMDALNFDEHGKTFYGSTDAGYVSQNVYLYCAQEGLKTCVCGNINRDTISSILGIKNGYVVLSQAVGK